MQKKNDDFGKAAVLKRLFDLADLNYKKFSSKLFLKPPVMLGVRLPELRKLSRKIPLEYLRAVPEFMEEKMLQGMIIGNMKGDIEEILPYIESFIPEIDNWSVCDSFCVGLKITKENRNRIFDFIKPYSKSGFEFEQRFFLVMALNYFVLPAYLNEIFSILNKAELNGYYAKMGAGWLVSVCYAKCKIETEKFLARNNLDKETFHFSIRKILESNRVEKSDKARIKRLYAG